MAASDPIGYLLRNPDLIQSVLAGQQGRLEVRLVRLNGRDLRREHPVLPPLACSRAKGRSAPEVGERHAKKVHEPVVGSVDANSGCRADGSSLHFL